MQSSDESVFTASEILENLPELVLKVSILADLRDGKIDQDSGQVLLGFEGCLYEGRGSDHESAYANFVSTFRRQGSWMSLSEEGRRFNDPAVFLGIKAALAAGELRRIVQLPPSESRD